MPQPVAHNADPGEKENDRRPIGEDFLRVVDALVAGKRLVEDIAQVRAGSPQAVADQNDKRAHHLMPHNCADRAGAGPRTQFFGVEDADIGKQALLYHVQQIEKPQTEGDIRIDEVGETEHQEIDADTQGRGAVEYFDAGRGHYRGNKIKVVVQGVDAIDEERQQQATPHHGIAENGLEDLFFTVGPVLDQRQRYLG